MARKFLTAIDLNKNELQNAVVQNLASAPGTPVEGQFYYDTTAHKLYWYNGSAWVDSEGIVAFGSVTAQTSFGSSSGNGSAGTASHSDHVHGTPTHDGTAHSAIKLSDIGGTNAGDIPLNSHKLTGVTDPGSAQDAATKAYVDAAAQGVTWKPSVRAASTATLTLSGAQTIDAVAVIAGDRVLVKNQGTASQNGIYVAASGAWARAADMDVSAEAITGSAVFIEEGGQANTGWILTTPAPITLATTSLTFTQFTGLSEVTAGTGLTKTGDTINAIAGTGIGVGADDIHIDHTTTPQLYAVSVGTGSATTITVTHNLGTTDVICQVYNISTGAMVEPDVATTGVNTLTVTFTTAPTTNQYRVVVHG